MKHWLMSSDYERHMLENIQFTPIEIANEFYQLHTSAITVSMHFWSPLYAAVSALDIAVAISSQEAAWAPSKGSKSRDIEFAKYYKKTSPLSFNKFLVVFSFFPYLKLCGTLAI